MNFTQFISIIQGLLILIYILAIFFRGRISRKFNMSEIITIVVITLLLLLFLFVIKKIKYIKY
jgi:hypothetical protein